MNPSEANLAISKMVYQTPRDAVAALLEHAGSDNEWVVLSLPRTRGATAQVRRRIAKAGRAKTGAWGPFWDYVELGIQQDSKIPFAYVLSGRVRPGADRDELRTLVGPAAPARNRHNHAIASIWEAQRETISEAVQAEARAWQHNLQAAGVAQDPQEGVPDATGGPETSHGRY